MACFHPIPALKDGSRVVLHPPLGSENLRLPCGNCIGCKIAKAQEWASRCVHELREHHSAVFATLTYDEEHLPKSRSLVPSELQLFIKRFRKDVWDCKGYVNVNGPESFYARRLRYIACGEYGDVNGRPHYHAILFGVSFNDASRVTDKLFSSPALKACWGFGNVNYGEVTRASCAYVAGYTAKSLGKSHCDSDGVVLERPFLRCSKGIGKRYADKYAEDFRSGVLVVDGNPTRLPRYYKKRLRALRPDVLQDAEFIQSMREREVFCSDRLIAGEVIAKRKRELTRTHSL